MDRRNFLKAGGAVAVVTGATTPSTGGQALASAQAPASPTVLSGHREFSLAVEWQADLVGSGVERLAHRIDVATEGRFRVVPGARAEAADLVYASAHSSFGRHAAFAFFAGLPFGLGLAAEQHAAWLAIGGQAMWDELAASLGFKPLVVDHTGPSALWSHVRLEDAADLSGLRIGVDGLAAEVVRALGAEPATLPASEMAPGLATRALAAGEWFGSVPSGGPAEPLAERLYVPGLHDQGGLLTLNVPLGVWHGLSATDRTILEACAAQEFALGRAERQAISRLPEARDGTTKWPIRETWPAPVELACTRAARELIDDLAAKDPSVRAVQADYQAFCGALGAA